MDLLSGEHSSKKAAILEHMTLASHDEMFLYLNGLATVRMFRNNHFVSDKNYVGVFFFLSLA